MKKEVAFLSAFSTALCLFTGCQNSQPIQEYSLVDLFSKSYVDSLGRDDTHKQFNLPFCQDNKRAWDSILLVQPYTIERMVKNLPIQNYGSIQQAVSNQSSSDFTYTLAFVSKGKYVALGVFPRNPIDFTTVDTKPLTWITRQNCDKFYLEKKKTDNKFFYILRRKGKD